MTDTRIDRVLIVHPDPAVRRDVETVLRRVHAHPVAVRASASPSEALQAARETDPRIVLLDLSRERALALTVARELRRYDRLLIGLFNPLLAGDASDAEFMRQAVRSGIGDFVPLPPSDAELSQALASIPDTRASVQEGKAIAFFGAQGGAGTTTLAINTALALAGGGARLRVALLDTNLQFGLAASYLSLNSEQDLATAIRELEHNAVPTLAPAGADGALSVLASPADPRDAERITPEDVSRVLIELRRRFSIVVVDTAPVLDMIALSVFDLAETVVVVTEGSAPSVAGTARLLGMLRSLGVEDARVRVVLSRHRDGQDVLPARAVGEQLGRPVNWVAPFLFPVALANHRGVPALYERQAAPFAEVARAIAADVARPARSARVS